MTVMRLNEKTGIETGKGKRETGKELVFDIIISP